MKVLRFQFILIALIAGSMLLEGCHLKPGRYRGEGFSIVPPKGWVREKSRGDRFYFVISEELPYYHTFYAPETVPNTEFPVARIDVITQEYSEGLFMEDLFPRILSDLKAHDNIIVKQGEIKLNGELSKWALYENKKRTHVTLETYIISDAGYFYKIRFKAFPQYFSQYRPTYEITKETFMFRFGLF